MAKTEQPKKPRGRPPRPENERRRSNLTLRVRDDTKAALQGRAANNGHSLSEEAESLLNQALASEGILLQALDMAFGKRVAGFVLLLTKIMTMVGPNAGLASDLLQGWSKDWLSNPYAHDQVRLAFGAVMDSTRPAETIITKHHTPTGEVAHVRGKIIADGMLKSLIEGDETEGREWIGPIRHRLGPALLGQIAKAISDG